MTISHPYRDLPTSASLFEKPGRWERFKMWLRGDDGHQWAVVTEPSQFRRAESRLEGPFTRRQAIRYASRYVAAHPYGEANLYRAPKDAPWPPKTTWGE